MRDRPELPDDLSPDQERAVIDALERALAAGETRPPTWALAGRVEATRQGTLQTRHQSAAPSWTRAARGGFARLGTEPVMGRGDAK